MIYVVRCVTIGIMYCYCLDIYKLDPANIFTTLQLLMDIDMLLMFDKENRSDLTKHIHRYVHKNNKHKEDIYLII